MPRISGQILVYAVIGVVLVLVGLNSIRGEKSVTRVPDGNSRTGISGDPAGEGGFKATGGSRQLVVDVTGAVRRPGVYRFAHGARVIDAIARAGGLARGAVAGAINRAATLSDGQQVVVPVASGSGGPGPSAAGSAVAGATGDAPVSLGTATQEQLEEIDGIGPVTAEKILEFRESEGGLGSIDDLDQISGIGPVTMESLRAALQP